ncbi:Uncharacterized membrane-anchored protein [Noviherbaspirillum humi]|uniref:Uncharacterized membrane-anchored protein n=2 Tax=Noviherbaspirillum humi TaxID=1688639 RepID=A0A239KMA9_9BURK|nr:Uncharacterized membrane-anchored protein [Noviherbaspirillum humi]
MKIYRHLGSAWVAIALFASASGVAQAAKIDAEAEMKAAVEASRAVAKEGPMDIDLARQATLKLPKGYTYIPQPQADQLLKAMGNGADASRLGIIFLPSGNSFVVPRFIDSGYIKDDEAKDWNADDMLKSLKAGTEKTNKERVARGIAEMEIVGWVQKPTYEKATHRLVWSIESKEKAGKDEAHGANYNTFVLGREGYVSMNLVTGTGTVAQDKPMVESLLANMKFKEGKAYADFNASTDKVAEYGIAALVTGIAAKKLGLFALIAAFAAKFVKVIAVAGLALFAGLFSLFKRKDKEQ